MKAKSNRLDDDEAGLVIRMSYAEHLCDILLAQLVHMMTDSSQKGHC
jgi:hypothetical protein